MPPEAVRSYVREYDVTAEEATDRIATQIISPGIRDVLQERFGDAVADAWFDNSSGEWVVSATEDVEAAEIADVMRRERLDDSYRREMVEFGHAEMVRLADELRDRLSKLHEQGDVNVGWGAARVDVKVSSTIDEADRRVTDEAVADARQRSNVRITRSVGGSTLKASPNATCSHPHCDRLLGGVRYEANGVGCSMGVPAYMNYVNVIMTAGHCPQLMGNGGTVFAKTAPGGSLIGVGTVHLGFNDFTNGDWGFILPASPYPSAFGYRPYWGWVNWYWPPYQPFLEYTQYSFLLSTVPAGATLCRNGATTTVTRCGTAQTVSGSYQNVNIEGCPGDSGSEVHQPGGGAATIHSGAYAPPGGCGSPSVTTTLYAVKAWASSFGWQMSIPAGP